MAIDIRATVTCSLGTLINASISDDYLQGSGLVKCKGSCEIAGIITPAIGTAVTFSYIKGGITRSVPRKLRVLSSFADPYRRTTKVELGCKLTYLTDLTEAVNWDAFDDPENATYTQADAEIITLPIHASSVMDECLSQLGLTASSNPLTSKFSVAKFDFKPGYVQVLGDLLVSESYCGYLDFNEVLQVFSLSDEGGTGPVISSSSIIDLGPIGVGQLPGEAVTVSYSTLKLNNPDTTNRTWETDESIGLPTIVAVSDPYYYTLSGGFFNYQYTPRSLTQVTYDSLDRVVKRVTTNYTIGAEIAPAYVQSRAGIAFNGLVVPPFGSISFITRSTEEFTYKVKASTVLSSGVLPSGYEEIDTETKYTEEPWCRMAASTSVYEYAATYSIDFDWGTQGEMFITEKTITRSESAYDSQGAQINKRITSKYQAKGYTTIGQQELGTTFNGTYPLWEYVLGQWQSNGNAEKALLLALELTYLGDEVSISIGREIGLQKRPSAADRINASLGQSVESSSQLELAFGSATAQRRIELTIPYPPDDSFVRNGVTYTAVAGDAAAKANLYGRVQNKLLMGNRNGMNLQLAPEVLPSAPFAPFVVQANGLSALYRNNGTSWTMDANGVVVSTDALFWGAVGGTGTFWFPVAPGITSLPSTPPVVDGQMTVSSVVPVWNETVLADATTRLTLTVSSLNYPLELLTVVPAIRTKTSITATAIRKVAVGSTAIAMAPLAPTLAINTVVQVPVSITSVAAIAPVVGATAVVNVPSSSLTLEALVPSQAGTAATAINVPNTDVAMAVALPAVITGVSIGVPAVDLSLNPLVPEVGGNLGEAFGLTALLADDLLDLDF